MCDHKPILVYEGGGNYYVCAECSQMLGPWEPNTRAPKALREGDSVDGITRISTAYGIIEDDAIHV